MKIIITILFLSFLISGYKPVRVELPCKVSLLIAVQNRMITQAGLTEKTGNNDGLNVENYLKAVGLNPKGKYPYCASGIVWSFKTGCSDLGLPYTEIPIKISASANAIFDDARRKGKPVSYLPKKYDLLVWKYLNSYNGHIEMIFNIINGVFAYTFGFNTGSGISGSQSNGGGNYFRLRALFDPLGSMMVRGVVGFRYES